jgi:hypothetical protein
MREGKDGSSRFSGLVAVRWDVARQFGELGRLTEQRATNSYFSAEGIGVSGTGTMIGTEERREGGVEGRNE